TTSNGTTGVIIRIWEMMHVHAYAGNYTATNRITYRLRIREKGSGTWLQTLGPYTRSITVTSSLLRTRLNWGHALLTYSFRNLPPAEYEIEITVTNKTISSGGNNGADSCFLLVEEIEEMKETVISLPEPIVVHYVAFEADSGEDENGDDGE